MTDDSFRPRSLRLTFSCSFLFFFFFFFGFCLVFVFVFFFASPAAAAAAAVAVAAPSCSSLLSAVVVAVVVVVVDVFFHQRRGNIRRGLSLGMLTFWGRATVCFNGFYRIFIGLFTSFTDFKGGGGARGLDSNGGSFLGAYRVFVTEFFFRCSFHGFSPPDWMDRFFFLNGFTEIDHRKRLQLWFYGPG